MPLTKELIHPVGKTGEPLIWKPAYGFPGYEVSEYSEVRNIKTGNVLRSNFGRVTLRKRGNLSNVQIYRLCLMSFYPNKPFDETVDHINEIHTDHHISNLQWLSQKANIQKSLKLRPRKANGRFNKPVIQLDRDGNEIAIFKSGKEAAEKTGCDVTNIRKTCNGDRASCGGFLWKYIDQSDLPGEVWKTTDRFKQLLLSRGIKKFRVNKIRISNKGRIKSSHGRKFFGKYGVDLQRKYRFFYGLRVHRLVWEVWGGGLPDNKNYEVLHDDSQPLDKDGCFSNAIEHLRVGTRSENMIESHAIGSLAKYKRQVVQCDPKTLKHIRVFSSLKEAKMITGASDIYNAARTNGTSAGYKWRYLHPQGDELKLQ